MDLFKKRYGERFDAQEKQRKKEARSVHEVAKKS
jgi:ribosome biogenesis protein NSA2